MFSKLVLVKATVFILFKSVAHWLQSIVTCFLDINFLKSVCVCVIIETVRIIANYT